MKHELTNVSKIIAIQCFLSEQTGNANGDVAPLLSKRDNIASPRPWNNGTEVMEVTEVTLMGDVSSVRNEVSLRSNSPAFTEGTLSPNPVAASVMRDIYEMYGAFDAGNKHRVIYLTEEKGHENGHPTENWSVSLTHLGDGPVYQQELRKEEEEQLRWKQQQQEREQEELIHQELEERDDMREQEVKIKQTTRGIRHR